MKGSKGRKDAVSTPLSTDLIPPVGLHPSVDRRVVIIIFPCTPGICGT